jgi:hypothetical protein
VRTDFIPPPPFPFGSAADLEARFGLPRPCRGGGGTWWFGYAADPRNKFCALLMCKNPNCPACWPRRLIASAVAVGCAIDDHKGGPIGFLPSPDADFDAQRHAVLGAGGAYARVGKGLLVFGAAAARLPGCRPLTPEQAWRKNLDLHAQADRPGPRQRLVTASQGLLPPAGAEFHERPQRERLREIDRGLKAANATARAAAAAGDDAATRAALDEHARLDCEKGALLGRGGGPAREERSDVPLPTVGRRADNVPDRGFRCKDVEHPDLRGWARGLETTCDKRVSPGRAERIYDYLKGRTMTVDSPWGEGDDQAGDQAGAG